MASFYIRDKSRFFWLNYRDPATGKVTQKSSKILIDSPDGKRDIKAKVAEWTMKEMKAPQCRERERWEVWVDGYLRERYAGSATLSPMLNSFVDLLKYFQEKGIQTPRQMTYPLTAEFLPWLKTPGRRKRNLKHNSARNRMACMSVLFSEAVRRGYMDHNLCRDARTNKEPSKEKPEITEGDEKRIIAELHGRQQWMRDQWIVLMHQGCRIAETDVPLSQIDTKAMTITFRIKGGKMHTAGLHRALLPLIERARSDGRKSIIEDPPSVPSWSPAWKKLFQALDMPYSVHCTRVTAITRMLRAGHSAALVSSLVGHSEEVNRIYRRLRPSDSQALLDTLGDGANPFADGPKR